MRIKQVCQRCGTVYATIEQVGGHPGLNALLTSMTGLKDRTLCPKCGSWVVGVEDGKELPAEFRPSGARLLRAVVYSALVWACFFWVASVIFADPTLMATAIDEAAKKAAGTAFFSFASKMGLCGAAAGCLICLIALAVAARRPDLDDPHSAGLISVGQAASLFPVLVASAVLGLLMGGWLAPLVAQANLPLHGILRRAVVGGIQGLLSGSASHWVLFKVCRSGRKWAR